jgi:hypothetical protein
MLAVSSRKYYLPVKSDDGWFLYRRDNLDESLYSKTFNYTLMWDESTVAEHPMAGEFKATFEYNGASVRPNMRTLRKMSAEKLQPIISRLSSYKDNEGSSLVTGDDLLREIRNKIYH